MPIIPSGSEIVADSSVVTLSLYAQNMPGLRECELRGVYNENEPHGACGNAWLKYQRDMVKRGLIEAQTEIERQLGYLLGPRRWVTDEQHDYSWPINTDWSRVISGGVRGTEDISVGEAVDHTNDPAVVGPIATTVTDVNEIAVFYPVSLVEEEVEIDPSDVDISGGNVTISIPRCRLVHPDNLDNDAQGVRYTDTTLFLQTVDVKRVYNDESTHAEMVWPNSCGCCMSNCPVCGEYTRDGCITVTDAYNGIVTVLRGTYSGGAWVGLTGCGRSVNVRLNYLSGLTPLTQEAINSIIRLAHTKMPYSPCGCDMTRQAWMADRKITGAITPERANCPFGMLDGAWTAWRFIRAQQDLELAVI
jgi:hypothetical protein